MERFDRDDVPVAVAAGDAEIRSSDLGGMTITFYRLPAGIEPVLSWRVSPVERARARTGLRHLRSAAHSLG